MTLLLTEELPGSGLTMSPELGIKTTHSADDRGGPMSTRALFLSVVLAVPAAAPAQVPLGTEFQVNTHTFLDQSYPSVASDANGNFVVVWHSWGQDGDQGGIFARRYDSSGNALGAGEFRVNSHTTGFQGNPVVASDAAGNFVVVWQSYLQDNSSWGLFAQRYDSTGIALGGEFQVNEFTTGGQGSAAVASDPAGDFAVAWTSNGQDGGQDGVFARRYDAGGAALGAEFRVNSHTTGEQSMPSLAFGLGGRLVAVWQSSSQDGSGQGVFAQLYDAAGGTTGGEFRVNSHTTGAQRHPSVAASDGGFVVVWNAAGQDGSGYGIFGQRYDPTGTPQGGEFQVNSYVTGTQLYPAAVMDASGDFVVAWQSDSQDGDAFGIVSRRFDAAGVPDGGDFLVNSHTGGFQALPALASAADGDFVVIWQSVGQESTDAGVFGQRFAADLIFRDGFESGGLGRWSAANNDAGDLGAASGAAMRSTTQGLRAVVDDTVGLYVQDDSPNDEDVYRARFYFDPVDFDPGEALAHRRVRIFVAFAENPSRRLIAVVLRRLNGQYAVMGRARRDDNTQADTGFMPIAPGPHWIEVFWARSTGQGFPNGAFQMWVDGNTTGIDPFIDNDLGAIDFVRLGAISVKSGASGTLYWDEFESRRLSYIGP